MDTKIKEIVLICTESKLNQTIVSTQAKLDTKLK
jgi:hypothetical protein